MEKTSLINWKEYLVPMGITKWEEIIKHPEYTGQYIPITNNLFGVLSFAELNLSIFYGEITEETIDDLIGFQKFLSGKSESPILVSSSLRGASFQYYADGKLFFNCSYCRIEIPKKFWDGLLGWTNHQIDLFKIMRPKAWEKIKGKI